MTHVPTTNYYSSELSTALRLKPCVALVAVLGVFGIADTASAIGPAGSTWLPRELVSNSVNYTEHYGANRILAFDHHGNPGVAFKEAGTFGDINYARKIPGFGWAAEDIFPNSSANDRGVYPSLAYDRYERPSISYITGSPTLFDAGLGFAHYDGNLWQRQTADSIISNDVGFWTSITYDHLGRAAIAYYDLGAEQVHFIHDTDGDFDFTDETRESVDNNPLTGETQISIAFDPLNRPMISYISSADGLTFAVKETVGWLTRTVDPDPLLTEHAASLAIDPDTGYPAIAYTSRLAGFNSLKYAEWDGNDWTTIVVDGAGNTGAEPSLAFDPTDGNPAIAYFGNDTGNLKIAWHDGGTWQDDVVDANSITGRNPSIAFREYGEGLKVAAIAYHDDAGNLWYIEDPPPGVVPEPATAVLMLFSGGALMRRSSRQPQKG